MESKKTKDIDIFIGKKLKQRRLALGMSQDKLGSYLGITFQQVQKYEKGINRISAGMLYTIATALNVSPGYFVDGFNSNTQHQNSSNKSLLTYVVDMNDKRESLDLLRNYYAISNLSVRKKVLELVKAFSHSSERNT